MSIQNCAETNAWIFFLSVQTRSSNQVSNDINLLERNNVAMRELLNLSELVDATKNKREYYEFQPKYASASIIVKIEI